MRLILEKVGALQYIDDSASGQPDAVAMKFQKSETMWFSRVCKSQGYKFMSCTVLRKQ